ncbi:hypothetical protein [Micromonospora halophytica]|uniref:Uncharacterized protein n=1 Tax=Micromonospora halophytica TaxID=47864 RepID=A0A1C5JEE8_9ACTN|nr:hypothetical protein [Micromonospora halophytica]SCG68396.1 hypothetical protein GA0070560_12768 [Micromonospora halophytica]
MSSNTPRILLIDDEVSKEESVAAGLRLSNLQVEVRSPNTVTRDDLRSSKVIAIDHHFDWTVVPHPSECLYWPQDGLAVAAVVTGHLRDMDHHAAVVLRTGNLDSIAGPLPSQLRQPAVAAENGLDWVFRKGDPAIADGLHSIARAVDGLEPLVADPTRWDEGCAWLDVPETKWKEAALADVQVCRPPENFVAAYTSGSAWLRWFAQRVLPFPTFIVPDIWAATLLRLPLEEFREILSEDNGLSEALNQCRYTGHLAELGEQRWWRAGLDSLVDSLLLDASTHLPEAEALAEQMTALRGSSVHTIGFDYPVVTIDSDYQPGEVLDASDCIRLTPDFWPVFGQEPWAAFDDLYDDLQLRKMVARGDRPRSRREGDDA